MNLNLPMLLGINEVAVWLDRPERQVERLAKAGQIPAVEIVDLEALHASGLDDDLPRLAHTGDGAARLTFRGLALRDGLNKGTLHATQKDAPGLPPWDYHESSFIRLALHLAARAQAAGMDCRPEEVVSTESYALSPTSAYLAALGREPEKMAGWTIGRIKATAPPGAFSDLWEADTRGQLTATAPRF